MPKLNRKNLEVLFVSAGVILVTAGVYSISRYGVAFMNVLNLVVGIYFLATSTIVVNKIKSIGGSKNGKKK